jgi:hypothetical protein
VGVEQAARRHNLLSLSRLLAGVSAATLMMRRRIAVRVKCGDRHGIKQKEPAVAGANAGSIELLVN